MGRCGCRVAFSIALPSLGRSILCRAPRYRRYLVSCPRFGSLGVRSCLIRICHDMASYFCRLLLHFGFIDFVSLIIELFIVGTLQMFVGPRRWRRAEHFLASSPKCQLIGVPNRALRNAPVSHREKHPDFKQLRLCAHIKSFRSSI